MKYMKLYLIPTLTIFIYACAQQNNSDNQYADDIAAINELREKEIIAAETGNVDSLLALRTDDFVAMPPNQPAVKGKEAVREFLAGIHEQTDTELEFISEEIIISGDWAYDRGILKGTVIAENDGESVNFEGTYLFILNRQVDNSWKYSLAMWSSY